MMVSLDSARQWYPREEFVACNADHIHIAKIKRGENSIYPSVRWAIKKALLSAGDLYSEAKGIHYGESRSLESADAESTLRRSLLQFAHSSIGISKCDEVQSSALPTRSVEIDKASILFDEDSATSEGIEVAASEDIRGDSNPDPARKYRVDDSEISPYSIRSMIMDEVMDAAITQGDEAKTGQLLAHSFDVNCKDGDGMTPLLLAARYQHESILRLLLERGANPRAQCNKGHTTLHWLALAHGTAITETSIDLLLRDRPPFEVADSNGITPLMAACIFGHLLLATRLIRYGADVRAKNSSGQTALHCAAHFGIATMVSILLDYGAELEVKSCQGGTPLHAAATGPSDSSDTVGQLIRAGADKEATIDMGLFRPLHVAIRSNNEACVKCLLESGVDVEARDEYGWRPLHIAVRHGQSRIVKMLLRHGADVEALAGDGWRPLHFAAGFCQHEIMKVLLDYGADPTAKTRMFLGSKPSDIPFYHDIPDTQKQAVTALLKEAERTWNKPSKK